MAEPSSVTSSNSLENEQLPGLPGRPQDGHKGTFGKILIIGGSSGMSGAVCLSSLAALRSGAGLVTAAVPASIQVIVAAHNPCVMTAGLDVGADAQLNAPSNEQLEFLLAGKDVVAIGPGLGQSEAAMQLVTMVLATCQVPLVMDADALNVAATGNLLSNRSVEFPCIITPHPGEFSRLNGKPIAESEEERIEMAVEFARKHSLTVVLKGPRTVITNGERLYINTTGNSGMATAGSGDVLTGIIAALIGQKMNPFEAAAMAAHAHGLTGNMVANEIGQRGMIALDLVDALPKTWEQIESR